MMTNFQFYSRLQAAWDCLRAFPEQERSDIMTQNHVWVRRWANRESRSDSDNIPSQVSVPDCRHLFRFESRVSGVQLAFILYDLIPDVIVGGVRVPLRWTQVPGIHDTYVCSPTP